MGLNGHGFGRKVDSADGRDKLYGAAHVTVPSQALPPSVDLRKKFPPVWDQGDTNSCGGQAGAALMSFFHPGMTFSALQLYYSTRELEGDVDQDGGVETRNILKVLQKTGVVPNQEWPFDASKVLTKPPVTVPAPYMLDSYSRLISGNDYLNCLASGFPFILGFMVPESLDGDEIARTGIFQIPDLKKEQITGGHICTVVGYDQTFKRTPFFEASGIDASKVDDTMLLVRNSWGNRWSPNFRGNFWLPLSYAVNPSTGGDAWSGRVAAKAMATDPIPAKPKPTSAQLDAAFSACRVAINETGYGNWVSDDKLRPVSNAVAKAVVQA